MHISVAGLIVLTHHINRGCSIGLCTKSHVSPLTDYYLTTQVHKDEHSTLTSYAIWLLLRSMKSNYISV